MQQGTAKQKLKVKGQKSKVSFCFLTFGFCLLTCHSIQAVQTCTAESEYMLAKAADCLDRRDSGCAKIKIANVLSKDPDCAEGLFMKAWILKYYDDKPEAAQVLEDRALKLNPKLSDFWEERGHSIESQLSTQEFSHFDIQFYGAEDRTKAWDAVKYLNDMYDHLGSVFATFPPKHIPVIIFTTEEFMDAWRAPFIGGFFDRRDGKVRIRVDEMPGGDEEFRHRARHEFTHAFIYQLYPHELPSWVSEGVAEYYARSLSAAGFWKEERLETIRKTWKYERWLTMADIQEAISQKKVSPYVIQQAYMESEALVIYMSKERGDSWIPSVMTYLRQHGGTFDAAFEAVLSITPDKAMEHLHHSWE